MACVDIATVVVSGKFSLPSEPAEQRLYGSSAPPPGSAASSGYRHEVQRWCIAMLS